MSFCAGIAEIIRPLTPANLMIIALGGLIVGVFLSLTRLPPVLSIFIGLVIGIFITLLQVGSLRGELFQIVQSISEWMLTSIKQGKVLEILPIKEMIHFWLQDLEILFNRLTSWLIYSFQGKSIFDPIALVFIWKMLIWSSIFWFGWSLKRNWNPLFAALPALTILSITLSYTRETHAHLLVMIGSLLTAMILARYANLEKAWSGKTGPSSSVQKTVRLTAIFIPVSLILLAAIVPSISLQRVSEGLQKFLTSEGTDGVFFENLGLKENPSLASSDFFAPFQAAGLPTRHLIGDPPELSEKQVMTIQITNEGDFNIDEFDAMRWRGLTYEFYNGRGWFARKTGSITHQANDLTSSPPPIPHINVNQKITKMESDSELVYFWGTLLSVDRNYRTSWRKFPEHSAEADLFAAMVQQRSYTAASAVPLISADHLRGASQSYPNWISDRYFELPTTVPDRVHALALELTATEPTPFDRALAIESYLRQYEYTLDIPPPPRGVEVSDYFLFTLKKGYCDYFATSMVVLARASGLPSRLAVGYLNGHKLPEPGAILITEDLAHSWPEIYFPSYGWVAFEPTSGRPPITRSHSLDDLSGILNIESAVISQGRAEIRWDQLIYILLSGTSLFLLVIFSLLLFQVLRRHSQTTPEIIRTDFQSFTNHAGRLGIRIDPSITPNELSHIVINQIKILMDSQFSSRILDRTQEMILFTTENFMTIRYGDQADQTWNKQELNRTRRGLSFRLCFALLLYRTRNLKSSHIKRAH